MEKRGIGHIEVILSFILFISATSLALYFFMPAYKTEIISSSLSYTYDSILKSANTELFTYYVQPENGDCTGKNIISLTIDEISGKGVIVEDKNGGEIGSKITGGKVCIDTCQNTIYSVYLSEGFTGSPSGCNGASADGIIVSSLLEKVISEDNIIKMANDYEETYDLLKEKLEIPTQTDFAFSLIFSTIRIDAEKEIPSGIDIYSQSTRLKVLRKDGKREFADFQVKVW
ncbi:MAG: hypothetical protein Q8L29_02970 [archaeon]|nr:hypothetical protein [archaeon]